MEEKKMIKFVTTDFWPFFSISSGDDIMLIFCDGSKQIKTCTYIDEYHARIGEDVFSLGEFALQTEHDGITYVPAKQIVLPDMCYVEHPENGQIVIVKRGEDGYFPTSPADHAGEDFGKVKRLNRSIGVDKRQAAAMLAGSMFGWAVPAADPMNYDMNGYLICIRSKYVPAHDKKKNELEMER